MFVDAEPEHGRGQEKPHDEVEVVMQVEADEARLADEFLSMGVAPLHDTAQRKSLSRKKPSTKTMPAATIIAKAMASELHPVAMSLS